MKFSMTLVVLGADLEVTEMQIETMIDAGLVIDSNGYALTVKGTGGRHLRIVDAVMTPEIELAVDRFIFKASPPGALTPDDETSNRSGFIPKAVTGKSEGGKP